MQTDGLCILLVDDSEVNQELWSAFLEAEGYEVVSARSGEEALEVVFAQEVDLVLLDVVMPGISGFDVLEKVRARIAPEVLPVIMATAKNQSEDVVRAFRLGANDYVTKPLDRAVTLARIEAQLRQRVRRGRDGSGEIAGVGADLHEDTRPVGSGLSWLEDLSGAGPGPVRGTVIDTKYRIDSLLGHGAHGAVYRATHLDLERPVALKILRTNVLADSTSLSRFRQEGISLSRLHHQHVVQVLDFGVDDQGLTYLVMELLDGETLDQELGRDGPLGLERTADIVLPIAEVLSEAHHLGIIHRDVKPQNVFLHRGRRGEIVKVLDFGIAKLAGETELEQRLTLAGNSVGTPAYMAPERFTDGAIDGGCDVYSLGVMVFEMLVGSTPFAGAGNNFFKLIRMHVVETPKALAEAADVPAEVDELVRRALAKKSADRPSAEEFGAALAEVVGRTWVEREPDKASDPEGADASPSATTERLDWADAD